MEVVAPVGPVYQAGTLSGNPLAVTAGLTTLRLLKEPGFYERLEKAAARLVEGMTEAAREAGVSTHSNRVGSMFTSFFTSEPVNDWGAANRCDREAYARFFHAMLDEGVYLAPSQFEAAFISAAHNDEIIERTISAARKAFAQV
jgi:glutamate-1-semialdehyde 2,1-aminomutase